MFAFFLKSYRCGILTFCGGDVNVYGDQQGINGKECFRRFDDGYFKQKDIISRHPNVVEAVIIGKKSWGLWSKQWCEGINECLFTREEILYEFEKHNIEIPLPLLKEFDNKLCKLRERRIQEETKRLKH